MRLHSKRANDDGDGLGNTHMSSPRRRLFCADRVVTCDAAKDGVGVLEQGALLVEGDTIVAVDTNPRHVEPRLP